MSISATPHLAAAAAESAVQALLVDTITSDDPALVTELEAWFSLPAATRVVARRHLLPFELDLPGHRRSADPSPEPSPEVGERDARAERLAAARDARAAAFHHEVLARFAPGGPAATLWAAARGDQESQDRVLLSSATELLAGLADADRELHRAAGRRFAMVAALAGPGTPAAGRRSDADRHLAHEAAIALRVSKDAAQHLIAQARSLFGEYAPFG
ncbi:MAG: hypothetical protein AB7O74_07135, partial [Candidatus Nanopelagicales bacterium]